ncbi:YraN family protein [Duganella fentianensis]|uniref:YraN family protein n=1 Tax=Duganella fentianensis TaxID=2692177 RepID=UPI0032B15D27
MASTLQQQLGQQGEDRALAYLQQQGLQLLERNFRCKVGELDLIMQHGAVLVFVEVRQRASHRYGGAAASVTPAKQRRLLRAAQYFLLRYAALPPCRFDLLAIDGENLSWMQNVLEM